jgi:hypothetical protein
MDSLCDITDPVVAGSGDFNNSGGIRPSTAYHRHRRGVNQNYSGPTAHLSLGLSIRLKSVTDDMFVVAIRGIQELLKYPNHFLLLAIFCILSCSLLYRDL